MDSLIHGEHTMVRIATLCIIASASSFVSYRYFAATIIIWFTTTCCTNQSCCLQDVTLKVILQTKLKHSQNICTINLGMNI